MGLLAILSLGVWCGFIYLVKRKGGSATVGIGGGFILALLLFAIAGAMIEPAGPAAAPAPRIATPKIGTQYKTRSGYLIAPTQGQYDKAVALAVDKVALAKLIDRGEAGILSQGITVYCDDIEFPGRIKIRLPGETEGVWTVIEAIEPGP